MRVPDLTAVVLACPDTLRAQNIIEACTPIRPGVSPILHGLEHGPVCLIMHVAQSWMVEHTQAVVQDLLLWDFGMLPGVQHPRCDILEDSRGDSTSGFIEDVGEVILGKHRVGWISAMGIRPWFKLVLPRGINDA